MRYLAIILLLSSCSAQYHLNKAIKKGYTCEETVQIDTIRITTLDSIPVIINDTIVWEKIINTKDTIIEWKTKNVYIPKTRQDKRIEYRLKAKTIYKDRIVEKAEAKAKTPKTKGNLNLLFVGVAIGLLLSYLFKFAKDKYLF
jgi:ABC-type anion transport system duplicated permease subunit